MQKYKKPLFTEKQLGVNPCLQTLIIPVIKLEDTQFFKKDEDILTYAEYEVESEKSTKFYVSSSRRKLVNGLSGMSSKLFLWIMQELDYNKDYLWINKERFMDECNVGSLNTFKTAITDLHKNNIIQPTVIKEVYWINPSMFFQGSRVKKFPKNIKMM